jgi:hypothetical protein
LFSKIYSLAENIELTEISDSEKVTLVFYNQCFSRNRRYAFAYYEHRLSKIRNLRWETGAVLPSQIRAKLSSRENDYFIEYNNILTDYCNELTLDLTTDLQVSSSSLSFKTYSLTLLSLSVSLCLSLLLSPQPPTDLYIEIRVLQSCGEIMTENGPIHLDIGTTHYLRRLPPLCLSPSPSDTGRTWSLSSAKAESNTSPITNDFTYYDDSR